MTFSQMHASTGEVPKNPKETLMILKPLNAMRFNVLHILSGRQSFFLASVFSISPVLPLTLWGIKNHLWKDQQIH